MTASHLAESLKHEWHAFSDAERRLILSALHPHSSVRNVNELDEERLSEGDRLADAVTRRLGSWRFIIIQSVILFFWITLNVIGMVRHWDPYPFILLNLALSFQAAYSAPVIMMSQNRQAAKDRLVAANDFTVNIQAEAEIARIKERLDDLGGRQWQALVDMQKQQLELLEAIHVLTRELHEQRRTG